jgi:hypothetical protein
MIPGVDTSGMGTYEIMNLIKAMLKDQPTPQIMDRLKALIPDVTAPAMTLDKIVNTIEARLTAKKALDAYMDQILARLRNMTGADVGNVDDGLYLAEAKIKAGAEAQAENASLHRILGRVKAKVNALFLDRGAILRKIAVVIEDRDQAQNRIAELIGGLCEDLDMPAHGVHAIRDEVQSLVTLRTNMRTLLGKEMTDEQLLDQVTQLLTFAGEYRGMSDTLVILRRTLGLGVDCAKDTIVAKVGDLVQERAQTREDLGLAPGQSVDALCTRLCKALGLSEDTSVAKTVNTLSEAFEAMHRVRDAIGLNENASVDYTVQKIADVRRAMLWAQGTVKMVREVLNIDSECDRAAILSTIAGLAKAKKTAEERHSAVLASLCEALDMPLHGATRVRDKIKTLRNELTETRDGLADRVSELDAIKDALSLSPATPASEVVDKVKDLHTGWPATVNHQAMVKALSLPTGMTSDEVARKIVEEVSFLRGQVDGLRGIAVKHRENLLSLLCEDPTRAVHMTVDEFQNLFKSKIAALALNVSLPEHATLNMIMERIQGMTPSMLCLQDLVEMLGTSKALTLNEALIMATNRIRGMRKGLLDLLNARP